MVRSNLPPSEGVFCGEELLDSGGCVAPPASVEEACVGLKGLEEASGQLDPVGFDPGVGILLVSVTTDLISSFATILSVAFAASAESLRSTRTLELLRILLLCREFVLLGGAGGCLVFITDRLRVKFCLVFASSPAATDPETSDSTFSLLLLKLLITLTELRTLMRSWSMLECSVWLSFPFRPALCELPLCVLPFEDTGEEFEIMVFEDWDSLQFEPEADVGISVASLWELSVWEPSPSDRLGNEGLTDKSPDAKLLLLTVRTLPPWFTLLPRIRLLLRSISMTSIEAGKTALGMIVDK